MLKSVMPPYKKTSRIDLQHFMCVEIKFAQLAMAMAGYNGATITSMKNF